MLTSLVLRQSLPVMFMASSSGIKKKEQRPSLAEALHYLLWQK
jgi:hypothetical protein